MVQIHLEAFILWCGELCGWWGYSRKKLRSKRFFKRRRDNQKDEATQAYKVACMNGGLSLISLVTTLMLSSLDVPHALTTKKTDDTQSPLIL